MNIDWSKCPEATHFDPVDQNFLREIGESLLLFNTMRGWTVPIYTQYGVTIKDCNRPLIKRPEWTGEGIPPAGTFCEFKSKSVEKWSECHVKYQFENGEAVVAICGPREVVLWVSGFDFRPIRTPDQIAADERQRVVMAIGDILITSRGNSNE